MEKDGFDRPILRQNELNASATAEIGQIFADMPAFLLHIALTAVQQCTSGMRVQHADSQDLLGEVLLQLVNNPRLADNLPGLVRCIAVGKRIDSHRKRKRLPLTGLEALPDACSGARSDPFEQAALAEESALVSASLEQLACSPRDRRIILLKLEGKDSKTIGKEVGESPTNTDQIYSRVVRKLRARFKR